MKRYFGLLLVIAYTLFGLGFALQNAYHPRTTVKSASAYVSVGDSLVDEINRQRLANGQNPLEIDSDLSKIADERTADMISRAYYAHESPSGQYFYDLMQRNDIDFGFACENLDLSFQASDAGFVGDWLASDKGHRECLLDSRLTRVGVAKADIHLPTTSNANLATAIFSD